MLALEIPVVVNCGVGDVDRIVAEAGAGVIVGSFDYESYRDAVTRLDELKPNMAVWRRITRREFDLQIGIERYAAIYRNLLHSSS